MPIPRIGNLVKMEQDKGAKLLGTLAGAKMECALFHSEPRQIRHGTASGAKSRGIAEDVLRQHR
jgi:hypothetical protein